jgi:hypothetical protein
LRQLIRTVFRTVLLSALLCGAAGGGNVGGGAQDWFTERAALRLEFRSHVFSSDTPHLFGFRVGIAFR